MTLHPCPFQTQACVLGVLFAAVSAGHAGDFSAKSTSALWGACQAWSSHIGDLIEQHRHVDDIGEVEFADIIRRFYDAQMACTAGRFTEAFAIYDAIPLGQVKSQSLR